jgi:hypothetical protein
MAKTTSPTLLECTVSFAYSGEYGENEICKEGATYRSDHPASESPRLVAAPGWWRIWHGR